MDKLLRARFGNTHLVAQYVPKLGLRYFLDHDIQPLEFWILIVIAATLVLVATTMAILSASLVFCFWCYRLSVKTKPYTYPVVIDYNGTSLNHSLTDLATIGLYPLEIMKLLQAQYDKVVPPPEMISRIEAEVQVLEYRMTQKELEQKALNELEDLLSRGAKQIASESQNTTNLRYSSKLNAYIRERPYD